MEQKSILIIGAGITGLSAGIYAQINGYRSKILELHTLPGGQCTAWKRKGYLVDNCIHWLVGSNPNSAYRKVWDELGALQGKTIVDHEEYSRLETADGKTLILYTNVDKLEQHLLELSPRDAGVIKEFTKAIRDLCGGDMPVDGNLFSTLKALPRLLPFLRAWRKYSKISIQQFADRFQDPFLRKIFPLTFLEGDVPIAPFMMTMGWMHKQDAGYPIGGSLPFAQSIAKRYQDLGGEIQYQAAVEKILVEDGKAVGVRLHNGEELRADVILSSADGHATIYGMLEGKYLDDAIRGYYEKMPVFDPILLIAYGINRDLSAYPHAIQTVFDSPIELGGVKTKSIFSKHYGYDPTLAPPGKAIVEVMINTDYDYWKGLAADRERYDAAKQEVALTVLDMLDERYGGIKDAVEMIDVATPLTYERYTGVWRGAYEGWKVTPQTVSMTASGQEMKKTLPGVENFYMAGQWVEPIGGLPTAAMAGRAFIKRFCKQDGKHFHST